jgi:hypothetical protein
VPGGDTTPEYSIDGRRIPGRLEGASAEEAVPFPGVESMTNGGYGRDAH